MAMKPLDPVARPQRSLPGCGDDDSLDLLHAPHWVSTICIGARYSGCATEGYV